MSDWGWLVGALPLVSGAVGGMREVLAPDLLRSATRHAELLKTIKDLGKNVPTAELEHTLQVEVDALARKARHRALREVSWAGVLAVALVAVVVAVVAGGLWFLDAGRLPHLEFFSLTRAAAVVVAVVGSLFLLVGLGQIWETRETASTTPAVRENDADDEGPTA